MPLHFTAQAHPNRKPAAIRHPRGPSRKPVAATGAAARTRARILSRSTTRQATALTTNACRKMSSRPMREMTKLNPSRESSAPATTPSSVEPVSRRVSRQRTTTATVPAIAEANRHPSGP